MQHFSPFEATLLFQWGNEIDTTVSALLSSHARIGIEKNTASNICHEVKLRGFKQVDLNREERPNVWEGMLSLSYAARLERAAQRSLAFPGPSQVAPRESISARKHPSKQMRRLGPRT